MEKASFCVEPMTVTPIGVGFALYDEDMQLLIFDRDRAKVEAKLGQLQKRQEKPSEERAGQIESLQEPLQKPQEEPLEYLTEEVAPQVEEIEVADIRLEMDKLTYAELRALAKEQGIVGYHQMKADALKQAIIDDPREALEQEGERLNGEVEDGE